MILYITSLARLVPGTKPNDTRLQEGYACMHYLVVMITELIHRLAVQFVRLSTDHEDVFK